MLGGQMHHLHQKTLTAKKNPREDIRFQNVGSKRKEYAGRTLGLVREKVAVPFTQNLARGESKIRKLNSA